MHILAQYVRLSELPADLLPTLRFWPPRHGEPPSPPGVHRLESNRPGSDAMRNSATHSSKNPAKEIALLKTQLEQLSEAINGTGSSILARGEEALEESLRSARQLIAKYGDTAKAVAQDTVKLKEKAADTLIEQTEARPLTTLTAILGIGFLAGWLCRRH
jgi:ElaB/YqjD/DUF883 family membrane-anchored ribosome-binding protein